MIKKEFQEYKGENHPRINKVKTTKGTTGFNRKTNPDLKCAEEKIYAVYNFLNVQKIGEFHLLL